MPIPTFPVIESQGSGSGTTSGTLATLNYPAGCRPGDLILFWIGLGATRAVAGPSGSGWVWDRGPTSGSSFGGITVAYGKKISDGSEGGTTFTVDYSNDDSYAYRTYRISNWGGTLGTTFDNTANAGHVEATFANSNNNAPDPPLLNPNNWGIEKTLWLAMECTENAQNVTNHPLPDNQFTIINGCTIAGCTDELEQESLNPGTFTSASGQVWRTMTIGVRGKVHPYSSAMLRGA